MSVGVEQMCRYQGGRKAIVICRVQEITTTVVEVIRRWIYTTISCQDRQQVVQIHDSASIR